MATRTASVLQISVLVCGTIFLLLFGFFAGVIVTGAGGQAQGPTAALPQSVAALKNGVPAQAGAPTGIPPGNAAASAQLSAQSSDSSSDESQSGPKKTTSLERLYDNTAYRGAYDYSDRVGDAIGDHTVEAAEPVFHGISAFLVKILPAPLALYVPGMTETAKFHVRSNIKEGSGNAVNDQLNDVTTSVKGGTGIGGRSGASGNGGESGSGGVTLASATVAAPSATSTSWSIQLGRFATVANAQAYAADLGRGGVNARVAREDGSDGRNWYDVRTVAYADRPAAATALDKLRAQGFDGELVSEASTGGPAG